MNKLTFILILFLIMIAALVITALYTKYILVVGVVSIIMFITILNSVE